MTREPTTDDAAEATVAAQDIARLADVGRAAVSNWRRRYPDFPEPVGGSSASPLYSLADVETWLTRHGKQFQLTPSDRIWQQARGAATDLRLGDLVGYLGAFLVLLQRDAKRWRTLAGKPDRTVAEQLTSAILAAVPELPDGLVERIDDSWVPIIRSAGGVADEQGHASLFEFLYDRYLQVHSRRYAGVTPVALAELMVDLVDVAGAEVFDPSCGLGTLLLAAHARGAAVLNGQEADESSARLAVVRLLLHDTGADVEVGDSLRHEAFADLRADVVLSNPPFSDRSWRYDELTSDPRWEYGLPPRGEPELAWLQHCLSHTKPDGHAVVTMPSGAASRRAGRRIRANLLRAGTLRAVISMSGASTAAAVPDLWVLRRPADQTSPSHVLMVNASGDPAIAVRAWRSLVDDPGTVSAYAAEAVRIIDLLDDEVDVSPARHLAAVPADAEIGQFAPLRALLAEAAATLADQMPDLVPSPDRQAFPMTTIGELAKAGAIAIHHGPPGTITDTGDVLMLTAEDLRSGTAASGRTHEVSNLVRIESGDVIVAADSREPAARVATDADMGVALGPRVQLLRPVDGRVDAHFLAGFLQAAQSQAAARGSSMLGRTDIRRTSVPRMSLTEQHEYGETFRRLTAFADSLRDTTSVGASLMRLAFTGLAEGSLRPVASNR